MTLQCSNGMLIIVLVIVQCMHAVIAICAYFYVINASICDVKLTCCDVEGACGNSLSQIVIARH